MGMTIEITRQKAVYLVNNHVSGGLSPVTRKMLYAGLKDGQSVFLTKGSKLMFNDGKYFISGYAEDGSDVRFP